MVSIPYDNIIDNNPGPSISQDPLNLSVTTVSEGATEDTSDEEDDYGSAAEQVISDVFTFKSLLYETQFV